MEPDAESISGKPVDEPTEESTGEPDAEEPTEESAKKPAQDDEPKEVSAPTLPTANELTYTGEVQVLVTGGGGLYSLDGENYSAEIPAAVNAGEIHRLFHPCRCHRRSALSHARHRRKGGVGV